MPSYKRYRRYRRSKGSRLNVVESAIAREMHKQNRLSQYAQELTRLQNAGFLKSDGSTRKDLFDMLRGHDDDRNYVRYRPGRVRGFGAYSVPGAIGRAVGAYATGGTMGLGRDLLHEVARANAASSGPHRPSIYDWQGSGAYSSANQLVGSPVASRTFTNTGNETNDVVISHREYIQDLIPTGTGFQTLYTAYQNPGLAASFPWLSQIAQYFEEYEFVQLLYTVESMVTEGNTNAAGTVIMCTQYNPTNAPFTSKATMENYEHSQSFKVTQHAVHGVECDPAKRGGNLAEYIRTGPVPSGQDPKTYDLGIFQVATQGAYPNLMIGELWVTYQVRLSKAKIPPVGTMNLNPTTLNVGSYNSINTSGLSDVDVMGVIAGGGNANTPYSCDPNFQFPSYAPQNEPYDNTNPNGLQNTGFLCGYGDAVGYYSPSGHKATFLWFPTVIEQGNYRLRFLCTSDGTAVGAGQTQANWEIQNGTIINSYQTETITGDVATAMGFTVRFTVNSPGTTDQCKIWLWFNNPINAIANQSWVLEQLPIDYTNSD